MTANIFIGCSGWYYLHWKGLFYPADMPSSRWFAHYISCFNAVEANSSFYRIPKPQNVKTWIRNVKSRDDFKYSVKMSKPITHVAKLDMITCEADAIAFFSAITLLNDLLGAILVQLPPSFMHNDETMQRLEGFKAWITNAASQDMYNGMDISSIPLVVEFRHASWFQQDVITKIEDLGYTFAVIDTPARAKLPMIYTGRDAIYLRLHGHDPVKWYRYDYADAELEIIKEQVDELVADTGARNAYIFFDNDFNGNAPRNALKLKSFFEP
ncbi:MAG TPA: DUF72 domain-containing protein [Candidatus Lokiarchaeia archaeon]|nr:DUF72 domain-containing protein [Candidatus Lokiarchaeia archaeon]